MDQNSVSENSNNSVPTLRPFISSFAPARNLGDYKGYATQIKVTPSSEIQQLINYYPDLDSLTNNISIKFGLSPNIPTIFDQIDFDKYQVSPNTAMIDLNVRLGNAFLRNITKKAVNVRYGVQMFDSTMLKSIDISVMQINQVLMVILQLLASYGVIQRYGKHIVEDRSN